MTAREMLDGLSSTLLCDERILSVPERELLANLLQRARAQVSEPKNAVTDAITRTVGEIVAERALGVLGESITHQLLRQPLPVIRAGTPPVPPPSPSPPDSSPRPPSTSPPSHIRAGTPPVPPPSPSPPDSSPRPPSTSPPSHIRAGA